VGHASRRHVLAEQQHVELVLEDRRGLLRAGAMDVDELLRRHRACPSDRPAARSPVLGYDRGAVGGRRR
jgi:hypothetical protein